MPNTNLHLDTHSNKEGLHLWISETFDIVQSIKVLQAELENRKKKNIKNTTWQSSMSVHLTRDDARKLIDNINHRLF